MFFDVDKLVGGPIPAYAGEPLRCKLYMISDGAYPRVCGGATRQRSMPATGMGLSPRMRGSLAKRQTPLYG